MLSNSELNQFYEMAGDISIDLKDETIALLAPILKKRNEELGEFLDEYVRIFNLAGGQYSDMKPYSFNECVLGDIWLQIVGLDRLIENKLSPSLIMVEAAFVSEQVGGIRYAIKSELNSFGLPAERVKNVTAKLNAHKRWQTDQITLAKERIKEIYEVNKAQFKRRGYTAQFIREMHDKYPEITAIKTIENLVSALNKNNELIPR